MHGVVLCDPCSRRRRGVRASVPNPGHLRVLPWYPSAAGDGGARAPELAHFVCLATELRTGGERRAGLDGELGD